MRRARHRDVFATRPKTGDVPRPRPRRGDNQPRGRAAHHATRRTVDATRQAARKRNRRNIGRVDDHACTHAHAWRDGKGSLWSQGGGGFGRSFCCLAPLLLVPGRKCRRRTFRARRAAAPARARARVSFSSLARARSAWPHTHSEREPTQRTATHHPPLPLHANRVREAPWPYDIASRVWRCCHGALWSESSLPPCSHWLRCLQRFWGHAIPPLHLLHLLRRNIHQYPRRSSHRRAPAQSGARYCSSCKREGLAST